MKKDKKIVNTVENKPCKTCNGTGFNEEKERQCPVCNGSGKQI